MQVTVALQAYLQQYSPNGQPVFEYTLPEGDRVTLIPPLAGRQGAAPAHLSTD